MELTEELQYDEEPSRSMSCARESDKPVDSDGSSSCSSSSEKKCEPFIIFKVSLHVVKNVCFLLPLELII